eukprot:CAMPEP_0203936038 /NCGR_PEP_ID=MMETSP0359-20131031/73682_1 /ASSEMBLY_ACC=CAM_ASM_000338 /TAXON_ID=268821 /ORGANISM="Scrippsiella Hangoei, Strain SHTV-5" /LENGTH=98 /DNA_ID=CAMNT_0050865959 /DNA_START=26 /DNA_END=322 /DNA_ORIENTATION=+
MGPLRTLLRLSSLAIICTAAPGHEAEAEIPAALRGSSPNPTNGSAVPASTTCGLKCKLSNFDEGLCHQLQYCCCNMYWPEHRGRMVGELFCLKVFQCT